MTVRLNATIFAHQKPLSYCMTVVKSVGRDANKADVLNTWTKRTQDIFTKTGESKNVIYIQLAIWHVKTKYKT